MVNGITPVCAGSSVECAIIANHSDLSACHWLAALIRDEPGHGSTSNQREVLAGDYIGRDIEFCARGGIGGGINSFNGNGYDWHIQERICPGSVRLYLP